MEGGCRTATFQLDTTLAFRPIMTCLFSNNASNSLFSHINQINNQSFSFDYPSCFASSINLSILRRSNKCPSNSWKANFARHLIKTFLGYVILKSIFKKKLKNLIFNKIVFANIILWVSCYFLLLLIYPHLRYIFFTVPRLISWASEGVEPVLPCGSEILSYCPLYTILSQLLIWYRVFKKIYYY